MRPLTPDLIPSIQLKNLWLQDKGTGSGKLISGFKDSPRCEYFSITFSLKHCVTLRNEVWCVCFPGPGKRECIQCAEGFLQQEWRCVQSCGPGYFPGEAAGVPHKMCHRWGILSPTNISGSSSLKHIFLHHWSTFFPLKSYYPYRDENE